MKNIKTFARFSILGTSPLANVLYFKKTRKGINRIEMKYFDNRFADEYSNLDGVNFEEIEKKAMSLDFVEVPENVADAIELGDYWSNYSLIKPFSNSTQFNEAVELYAGYEGTPELK